MLKEVEMEGSGKYELTSNSYNYDDMKLSFVLQPECISSKFIDS